MKRTLLGVFVLLVTTGPARAESLCDRQPQCACQPQCVYVPACECQPQCDYRPPCPTCWTVVADTVALQRSAPRQQVLLRNTTTTLLDAHDFETGFEMGPRMSIIYHPDPGYGLEFGYFQLDGWHAHLEDSTAGGRTAVLGNTDWTLPGSGLFEAYYTSRFYSGESNLRVTLPEENVFDHLSLLLGVRYFELDEAMHSEYASSAVWQTKTKNRMYGLQIGADGLLDYRLGPVRIGGTAKAGVYYNQAKAFNTETLPTAGSEALSEDVTSFLGEVSLNLLLPISRNVSIRGGYQCMWLQTVAVAPEQVLSSGLTGGTGTVDTGGSLFAHGAFLGLQASF